MNETLWKSATNRMVTFSMKGVSVFLLADSKIYWTALATTRAVDWKFPIWVIARENRSLQASVAFAIG
jgi:hypothetical protein